MHTIIIVYMSAGSYLAAPFLYLNLGSHMLEVLKNRLKAQMIPSDKSARIIADIVNGIFKEQFIKTLMIPQQPISIPVLKDIFTRLAHSSIMKLDASSMDKLIYLILMTVKKEAFLLSSPLELYALTLGNLLTLSTYVDGTSAHALVINAADLFKSAASQYSFMQYLQIREHILGVMEAYQTRVINFAQSNQQDAKGKFIYKSRNMHNCRPVGQGLQNFSHSLPQEELPSILLPYESWQKWKTNLVMDYAVEYERQSNKRNGFKEASKEKSINEFFSISSSALQEYEVTLDIFDEGNVSKTNGATADKSKEGQVKPGQVKPGQVKPVQLKSKQQSWGMKNKIAAEFDDLKLEEKQEQPDLLDLMDN